MEDNIMSLKAVPTSYTSPVYVAPVRKDTEHLPLLDTDDLPSNIFWATLGRALTLRRKYGTKTEAGYVAWLANRLPVSLIDGAGNVHVDLRTLPHHRTMFTSHTDSVHSSGGENNVHVDGSFWRASKGSALGADDGAGNAIMAHMIERGVPGYYVFFRGEECGGVGSKWMADEMPELCKDLDRAVAFDRAGYYDIITHQAGGRCCSDDFAQDLANQLSTENSWFLPCNGGVYTDTAEFIELIPECTNISVGYKNQHGDREEQDVDFLWGLAQACVLVEWDNLVTARDPKVKESRYGFTDDWDDWARDYRKKHNLTANPTAKANAAFDDLPTDDELELELYDEEVIQAMDAVHEALEYGVYRWLMEMIASFMHPQDIDICLKNLDEDKLDTECLEYAYEMLETGYSVHVVMAELYDMCVVT